MKLLVPLVIGVLCSPQWAQACAVCFSPNDQTRIAFIAMTIFMTSMPLLIVGGTLWWIRNRIREANEEFPPSQP